MPQRFRNSALPRAVVSPRARVHGRFIHFEADVITPRALHVYIYTLAYFGLSSRYTALLSLSRAVFTLIKLPGREAGVEHADQIEPAGGPSMCVWFPHIALGYLHSFPASTGNRH